MRLTETALRSHPGAGPALAAFIVMLLGAAFMLGGSSSVKAQSGTQLAAPQSGTGSEGLLRVETIPPLQTTIYVDGVPRGVWGIDWLALPPGNYNITLTDVSGYQAPGAYNVTFYGVESGSELLPVDTPVPVYANTTTVVTARLAQDGMLTVRTFPPLLTTISLDGVPVADYGVGLSLPPGDYTIGFTDVPGYVSAGLLNVSYSGPKAPWSGWRILPSGARVGVYAGILASVSVTYTVKTQTAAARAP